MDPEEYRVVTRERWEAAAPGWAAGSDAMQRATMPVTRWLVEGARLRPGHVVLELAAGTGDTGLMAAELVAPGGRVVVTDGANAMVEVARARAQARGAENVELRTMEAEWIDLATATVDAVLCRWGYMLLADPEAALRETRRVLRPGGRVALAVWDGPDANPWMTLAFRELAGRGVMPGPEPGVPGPFALADRGRLAGLLEDTGFEDVEVEAVDFAFDAASVDEWWEHLVRTSPTMGAAVRELSPADHYALREAVDAAYAPYAAPDGSLRLPARAIVAAAGA